MMRAFKSERNFSKGIDNAFYLRLYNISKGYYLTRKHYPKHFEKIRMLLLKATYKISKWKLTENERFRVQRFSIQISEATSEDCFFQAINGLLDATQRFRDF